jgi:hypothetical protein
VDVLDDSSTVLLLVLPCDKAEGFRDTLMQWFAAQSDKPKSVIKLASSCREHATTSTSVPVHTCLLEWKLKRHHCIL